MHHGQLGCAWFERFNIAGHGVIQESAHILASDHQRANSLAWVVFVVEVMRITMALMNVIHGGFSVRHGTHVCVHFAQSREIDLGACDLARAADHVIWGRGIEDFVDQIRDLCEVLLHEAALGQPGGAHADACGG